MYYKIIDNELVKSVEAIITKRHEATKAFLRLSRRVGASRTRYGASDMVHRSFSFVFNKAPDRAHWKCDRSGNHWAPKLSSKEGKKVDAQVRDIMKMDGSLWELTKLFGVDDIFKCVGILKIGHEVIVEFGDDWKFSTDGLERISDVEVEKLEVERNNNDTRPDVCLD